MYSIVFIFMYFIILLVFHVSEMYLDRFQDKQDEAKGLEYTMKSVIEQFKKRSAFSTQTGKM